MFIKSALIRHWLNQEITIKDYASYITNVGDNISWDRQLRDKMRRKLKLMALVPWEILWYLFCDSMIYQFLESFEAANTVHRILFFNKEWLMLKKMYTKNFISKLIWRDLIGSEDKLQWMWTACCSPLRNFLCLNVDYWKPLHSCSGWHCSSDINWSEAIKKLKEETN